MQSTTDEIRIQASKSITLTAGQSQIVIQGGNITFTCPGTWTVKGASHDWLGGGSGDVSLLNMPSPEKQDQWVELNFRDLEALPMVGAPYVMKFASGVEVSGQLDAKGHARIQGVPPESYTVRYGESSESPRIRREQPANPLLGAPRAKTQEEAEAMLKRFLDAEDKHLQDNHFPDEIAAMRAEQEGVIVLTLDQHADDYMMSSEQADQRAQQGYRSEHPEGKGVNA